MNMRQIVGKAGFAHGVLHLVDSEKYDSFMAIFNLAALAVTDDVETVERILTLVTTNAGAYQGLCEDNPAPEESLVRFIDYCLSKGSN